VSANQYWESSQPVGGLVPKNQSVPTRPSVPATWTWGDALDVKSPGLVAATGYYTRDAPYDFDLRGSDGTGT